MGKNDAKKNKSSNKVGGKPKKTKAEKEAELEAFFAQDGGAGEPADEGDFEELMAKHAEAVAAAEAAPPPPFSTDALTLEKSMGMAELKEALESYDLQSTGSRKDRAKRLAEKMREMKAATVPPPEPERPTAGDGGGDFDDDEEEQEELGNPIDILEEFTGDVDEFKVRLFGKKQLPQRERIERVNAANKKNQTLLHLAVDMQMEAVLPLLIKQGADVNARDKQGKTPAQIAIELGSVEAIDALLAAKNLDTETYDKQGTTILIGALKLAQWGVAQTILGLGADVLRSDRRKNTPLHAICLGAQELEGGVPASVEALIADLVAKGSSGGKHLVLDKQEFDGATPLMLAAGLRDASVRNTLCTLLMEAGADVKLLSRRGGSCADVATARGDSNLAQMMIDRGAPDGGGKGGVLEQKAKEEEESEEARFEREEKEAMEAQERMAKAELAMLKANEHRKTKKQRAKEKEEEAAKPSGLTGCFMILGALMAIMMAYLVLTEPEEGFGGRHRQQQEVEPAEPPPPPAPMELGSACNGFDRICPSPLVCELDEALDYSICMNP
eukprot:COSAG02_NODE_121_length_35326_cov_25.450819_26_plen_557_part_00